MFKRLAIVAALLSACGPETSTPPRVVTFDDVFVGYAPIENDCDWQEVDISVFNQKDLRVSFRHRFCELEKKFIGGKYLSNQNFGSGVYGLVQNGNTESIVPLFSIDKLGPLTPEEFIEQEIMTRIGLSAGSCSYSQEENFLWRIIPYNQDTNDKDEQNKQKYRTVCEVLSTQYFGIKDGLVISYPGPNIANAYLDPASITYTNRG